MKKTFIRIICFICLLTTSLYMLNRMLSFKYSDGSLQMTHFYELDRDTVDVLVLGSSHSFVSFSNGTLWDEYGIASYNLGGAMQPLWNTYYNLEEALKTQTPELIVLEGFCTCFNIEYSSEGDVIKNTYGMKWSPTKFNAIKTSVPTEQAPDFLLDYGRYHNRYSSLSKSDFTFDYDVQTADSNWLGEDWKGQFLFSTNTPLNIPDVSSVDYESPMVPKAETYYRKIFELANSKNIPIVVVLAPYEISESEQSVFLYAEKIAHEYGAGFINCNLLLDEIGIDPASDFHDFWHLTAKGASKFSSFIGEYLTSNYTISDRRGNPKYYSWEKWSDFSRQYEFASTIRDTSTLNDMQGLLDNPNYWTIISSSESESPSSAITENFLQNLGLNNHTPKGIWLVQDHQILYGTDSDYLEEYIQTDTHDFCLMHNEYDENQLIIDNKTIEDKVSNGLNITIYDTVLNTTIDSFGIDYTSDYCIVR